ncbi:MAG TPA: hypothetical protein VGL53_09145 [Bryobacteraceae bacterium]
MKRNVTIVQRLSFAVATSAFASLILGQNLTPQNLSPEAKRLLDWSQSHKQLNWTGAGGCVVDFVHTPCRTVRSHEFSFGRGLGFDGIRSVDTIEAFDKDGSTSRTYSIAEWPFWHLPAPTTKRTHITRRTQNRRIAIDHDHAVFEEYPGGAHSGTPMWEEDDQQCSHMKSHYLYLSERLPDSIVIGVGVVGYSGTDDGGSHYEVFFAPSLGCEQLRSLMWRQNHFGLRTAYSERVVDSFELGAPSPTLFAVPRGFTRVEP